MLTRLDNISQYTICIHTGNTEISVVLFTSFFHLFHSLPEMTATLRQNEDSKTKGSKVFGILWIHHFSLS